LKRGNVICVCQAAFLFVVFSVRGGYAETDPCALDDLGEPLAGFCGGRARRCSAQTKSISRLPGLPLKMNIARPNICSTGCASGHDIGSAMRWLGPPTLLSFKEEHTKDKVFSVSINCLSLRGSALARPKLPMGF
jgi:hypothetical protein